MVDLSPKMAIITLNINFINKLTKKQDLQKELKKTSWTQIHLVYQKIHFKYDIHGVKIKMEKDTLIK